MFTTGNRKITPCGYSYSMFSKLLLKEAFGVIQTEAQPGQIAQANDFEDCNDEDWCKYITIDKIGRIDMYFISQAKVLSIKRIPND